MSEKRGEVEVEAEVVGEERKVDIVHAAHRLRVEGQ
jgi:hypothetical protein